MSKLPRISNRLVILVGLLAAGMAGQTRFSDGLERGPGLLDVVFLVALCAVLVGLGRSFAKAASDVVDEHLEMRRDPVGDADAMGAGGDVWAGKARKDRP